MPVVFQQMPLGNVLGFMWFGLLFFAGITSSVAMSTPIMAFFREEFGVKREKVAYALGVVVLLFGLMHIYWQRYGVLDDWDFWGGTFGLVVVAVVETILFMWVFKPENAWRSLHQGADIRIPAIFKFIMTYVTPLYIAIILLTWGWQDAVPNLRMDDVPAESAPFLLASRLIIIGFFVVAFVLVRLAWKRNRYDDRKGFVEVEL
jgi:SNF family Na+-dependent transporter